MPRHSQPLELDTDYLVLEEEALVTVAQADGSQVQRPTKTVQKVYLAATNEETYLCTRCKAYTHENPGSVITHNASGHSERRSTPKDPDLERHAAAFRLLPPAMQESLLKRLDEGDKPPAKARAPRGTATTTFGLQPLAAVLNGGDEWVHVAEQAGMSVGNLRNIARGAHGTGLTNAQKISDALNRPLVELFNKKMLRSIAARK